jgi:hypothetical protein
MPGPLTPEQLRLKLKLAAAQDADAAPPAPQPAAQPAAPSRTGRSAEELRRLKGKPEEDQVLSLADDASYVAAMVHKGLIGGGTRLLAGTLAAPEGLYAAGKRAFGLEPYVPPSWSPAGAVLSALDEERGYVDPTIEATKGSSNYVHKIIKEGLGLAAQSTADPSIIFGGRIASEVGTGLTKAMPVMADYAATAGGRFAQMLAGTKNTVGAVGRAAAADPAATAAATNIGATSAAGELIGNYRETGKMPGLDRETLAGVLSGSIEGITEVTPGGGAASEFVKAGGKAAFEGALKLVREWGMDLVKNEMPREVVGSFLQEFAGPLVAEGRTPTEKEIYDAVGNIPVTMLSTVFQSAGTSLPVHMAGRVQQAIQVRMAEARRRGAEAQLGAAMEAEAAGSPMDRAIEEARARQAALDPSNANAAFVSAQGVPVGSAEDSRREVIGIDAATGQPIFRDKFGPLAQQRWADQIDNPSGTDFDAEGDAAQYDPMQADIDAAAQRPSDREYQPGATPSGWDNYVPAPPGVTPEQAWNEQMDAMGGDPDLIQRKDVMPFPGQAGRVGPERERLTTPIPGNAAAAAVSALEGDPALTPEQRAWQRAQQAEDQGFDARADAEYQPPQRGSALPPRVERADTSEFEDPTQPDTPEQRAARIARQLEEGNALQEYEAKIKAGMDRDAAIAEVLGGRRANMAFDTAQRMEREQADLARQATRNEIEQAWQTSPENEQGLMSERDLPPEQDAPGITPKKAPQASPAREREDIVRAGQIDTILRRIDAESAANPRAAAALAGERAQLLAERRTIDTAARTGKRGEQGMGGLSREEKARQAAEIAVSEERRAREQARETRAREAVGDVIRGQQEKGTKPTLSDPQEVTPDTPAQALRTKQIELGMKSENPEVKKAAEEALRAELLGTPAPTPAAPAAPTGTKRQAADDEQSDWQVDNEGAHAIAAEIGRIFGVQIVIHPNQRAFDHALAVFSAPEGTVAFFHEDANEIHLKANGNFYQHLAHELGHKVLTTLPADQRAAILAEVRANLPRKTFAAIEKRWGFMPFFTPGGVPDAVAEEAFAELVSALMVEDPKFVAGLMRSEEAKSAFARWMTTLEGMFKRLLEIVNSRETVTSVKAKRTRGMDLVRREALRHVRQIAAAREVLNAPAPAFEQEAPAFEQEAPAFEQEAPEIRAMVEDDGFAEDAATGKVVMTNQEREDAQRGTEQPVRPVPPSPTGKAVEPAPPGLGEARPSPVPGQQTIPEAAPALREKAQLERVANLPEDTEVRTQPDLVPGQPETAAQNRLNTNNPPQATRPGAPGTAVARGRAPTAEERTEAAQQQLETEFTSLASSRTVHFIRGATRQVQVAPLAPSLNAIAKGSDDSPLFHVAQDEMTGEWFILEQKPGESMRLAMTAEDTRAHQEAIKAGDAKGASSIISAHAFPTYEALRDSFTTRGGRGDILYRTRKTVMEGTAAATTEEVNDQAADPIEVQDPAPRVSTDAEGTVDSMLEAGDEREAVGGFQVQSKKTAKANPVIFGGGKRQKDPNGDPEREGLEGPNDPVGESPRARAVFENIVGRLTKLYEGATEDARELIQQFNRALRTLGVSSPEGQRTLDSLEKARRAGDARTKETLGHVIALIKQEAHGERTYQRRFRNRPEPTLPRNKAEADKMLERRAERREKMRKHDPTAQRMSADFAIASVNPFMSAGTGQVAFSELTPSMQQLLRDSAAPVEGMKDKLTKKQQMALRNIQLQMPGVGFRLASLDGAKGEFEVLPNGSALITLDMDRINSDLDFIKTLAHEVFHASFSYPEVKWAVLDAVEATLGKRNFARMKAEMAKDPRFQKLLELNNIKVNSPDAEDLLTDEAIAYAVAYEIENGNVALAQSILCASNMGNKLSVSAILAAGEVPSVERNTARMFLEERLSQLGDWIENTVSTISPDERAAAEAELKAARDRRTTRESPAESYPGEDPYDTERQSQSLAPEPRPEARRRVGKTTRPVQAVIPHARQLAEIARIAQLATSRRLTHLAQVTMMDPTAQARVSEAVDNLAEAMGAAQRAETRQPNMSDADHQEYKERFAARVAAAEAALRTAEDGLLTAMKADKRLRALAKDLQGRELWGRPKVMPTPHVEPMNFQMPASMNTWGAGTTTLQAIKDGKRTSTTRREWKNGLPAPGQILTFQDGKGGTVDVVVTKVAYVPKEPSREWIDQWVQKEGWTEAAARERNFWKGHQVEFRLATQADLDAVQTAPHKRDLRQSADPADDAPITPEQKERESFQNNMERNMAMASLRTPEATETHWAMQVATYFKELPKSIFVQYRKLGRAATLTEARIKRGLDSFYNAMMRAPDIGQSAALEVFSAVTDEKGNFKKGALDAYQLWSHWAAMRDVQSQLAEMGANRIDGAAAIFGLTDRGEAIRAEEKFSRYMNYLNEQIGNNPLAKAIDGRYSRVYERLRSQLGHMGIADARELSPYYFHRINLKQNTQEAKDYTAKMRELMPKIDALVPTSGSPLRAETSLTAFSQNGFESVSEAVTSMTRAIGGMYLKQAAEEASVHNEVAAAATERNAETFADAIKAAGTNGDATVAANIAAFFATWASAKQPHTMSKAPWQTDHADLIAKLASLEGENRTAWWETVKAAGITPKALAQLAADMHEQGSVVESQMIEKALSPKAWLDPTNPAAWAKTNLDLLPKGFVPVSISGDSRASVESEEDGPPVFSDIAKAIMEMAQASSRSPVLVLPENIAAEITTRRQWRMDQINARFGKSVEAKVRKLSVRFQLMRPWTIFSYLWSNWIGNPTAMLLSDPGALSYVHAADMLLARARNAPDSLTDAERNLLFIMRQEGLLETGFTTDLDSANPFAAKLASQLLHDEQRGILKRLLTDPDGTVFAKWDRGTFGVKRSVDDMWRVASFMREIQQDPYLARELGSALTSRPLTGTWKRAAHKWASFVAHTPHRFVGALSGNWSRSKYAGMNRLASIDAEMADAGERGKSATADIAAGKRVAQYAGERIRGTLGNYDAVSELAEGWLGRRLLNPFVGYTNNAIRITFQAMSNAFAEVHEARGAMGKTKAAAGASLRFGAAIAIIPVFVRVMNAALREALDDDDEYEKWLAARSSNPWTQLYVGEGRTVGISSIAGDVVRTLGFDTLAADVESAVKYGDYASMTTKALVATARPLADPQLGAVQAVLALSPWNYDRTTGGFRNAYNPAQSMLQPFGLAPTYDYFAGTDNLHGEDVGLSLLGVRKMDPKDVQIAYAKRLVSQFNAEHNYGRGDVAVQIDAAGRMRNSMRRAVQRGDYEHAAELLAELQQYADDTLTDDVAGERTYDASNVLKSFGAGDVRHNLAPGVKDRKAAYDRFLRWLSPDDKRYFQEAQEFQQKTLDPWRNPALRAMLIRGSNTPERQETTARVLANRLDTQVREYETDTGETKFAAINAVAERLNLDPAQVRAALRVKSLMRQAVGPKGKPDKPWKLEQAMELARESGFTR